MNFQVFLKEHFRCLNNHDAQLAYSDFNKDAGYIDFESNIQRKCKDVLPFYERLEKFFPDYELTHDPISYLPGQFVLVKWRFYGTNSSQVLDCPATNFRLVQDGITIFQFEKNKIKNACVAQNWDNVCWSQQLLFGSANTKLSKIKSSNNKYRNSGLTPALAGNLKSALLDLRDNTLFILQNDLSLQKLAKKLATQPCYLSQVFNQELGMTFFEFVSEYRIAQAKKMMSNPDMSSNGIVEISEYVGFNSLSCFYTAFKKQTGLTPKQYISAIHLKGESI